MIWLLAKFGLASDLRRVPESRVVLAQMTEARRKAERDLQKLQESPDHAWRDAATAAIHARLDQLSKSYHELEQALAERVDLSRKALRRWKLELREFRAHLAEIRAFRLPSVPA
jgi:stearoyl-CoA desaturase (delta-9 desaturase)